MLSERGKSSRGVSYYRQFWATSLFPGKEKTTLAFKMWKSIVNLSSTAHFGYRKRMTFYLLLFIFYAVQLALYRKNLKNGSVHDSSINSDYLVAVDVLLLVQSLLSLGCGWIFRPIFQNISIVFNAIIFGLTFGWLILAAPNASQHQIYYAINGLIVLILIVIDVSVMFYVRPDIITVGVVGSLPHTSRKQRKSLNAAPISTGSPSAKLSTSEKLRGAVSSILPSYGKVRHRFLHSEEGVLHGNGPMADKADEEMGTGSDKDEFVRIYNSSGTGPARRHSAQSVGSAGSSSPFHDGETGEKLLEEEEVILGGYKIDTNDKMICEGFRINMTNLPCLENNDTPRNLTWDDFSQVHHIVDSSSCHIYTAVWKNQVVVLKLIKAERVSSAVAVAEFEAEEGVLSRIRHPNIVRFLGSGKSPRKFLVLELLSGGSLSHVLGLRSDSRNQTWEKRFSFLETLDFALSLAQALKYLHHDWSPSVHIIHRDLKPDNIGFAPDGRVKLFDFGLCASVRAQREKTEQYRLTGNTGTLRYMAPEVVLGRSYHHSVDVYSFGILIWQVASGKVPFRDMGKKTYFDRVVVGGQRPRIDTRWPLAFAHLLRQCWHEDKHARPSFITIVQELEMLVKQEESLVLAQHNRLHRRLMRSCMWCLTRFRPVFFLLLLAVFCTSLWMVVDVDDTVLGSVLGALSTFGIYAILMSYLAVWPSSSLSPTGTASKYKAVGDGDIEEKIEHQRKLRAIITNARIIRPPGASANASAGNGTSSPLPSMHSSGSQHNASKRTPSSTNKIPRMPSSPSSIELQQIDVRTVPDSVRAPAAAERVMVDLRNGNMSGGDTTTTTTNNNSNNSSSTLYNRVNGTSNSLSVPTVV